ncbi:MAG: hypothetical protein ACOYOP_04030 [Microthrixaceae bacterium]
MDGTGQVEEDVDVDVQHDSDIAESDPAADVGGDPVADVVARVRADLAERRRRGELPDLPAGELERQFDAVVEAADAGLVEEPDTDLGPLRAEAALPTWRPVPMGNPVRRVVVIVSGLLARVTGVFVRRQVGGFTQRTTAAIEELTARQQRLTHFLARAHLDRIRTLEYRIAQLEEEVLRLRRESAAGEHD